MIVFDVVFVALFLVVLAVVGRRLYRLAAEATALESRFLAERQLHSEVERARIPDVATAGELTHEAGNAVDPELSKLAKRLSDGDRRSHDELRMAVDRLSRRCDSLEDRLGVDMADLSYLRQERRLVEDEIVLQVRSVSGQIDQLQAVSRVLGSQLEELEQEMKRRFAASAQVRRMGSIPYRVLREQRIVAAIDEVLAEPQVAERTEEMYKLPREVGGSLPAG